MDKPDFTIDYDTDVPQFPVELQDEIERRLIDLADDHSDLTGAAVAVSEPARTQTPYIYQVRIVAYVRPEDIVAVKKSDTLEGAVKGALDAIERQVREKREKLRETWKRPDIPGSPGDAASK